MKFCLVIEHNKRNNFFKNHAEKKARRLAPDVLLLFKKALYEVKVSGIQFNFHIPQLVII